MTIHDDLTHTNLSRQRKYQIRKLRQNKCTICGLEIRDKRINSLTTRCLKCSIKVREAQRIKRGLVKRYLMSKSYKAERIQILQDLNLDNYNI